MACWPQGSHVEVVRHAAIISWPVGLMDKASASGDGDSRLESWAGHVQPAVCRTHAVLPQLAVMIAAANGMGSVAYWIRRCLSEPQIAGLSPCKSHAQHADAAPRTCTCVRRLLVCVMRLYRYLHSMHKLFE